MSDCHFLVLLINISLPIDFTGKFTRGILVHINYGKNNNWQTFKSTRSQTLATCMAAGIAWHFYWIPNFQCRTGMRVSQFWIDCNSFPYLTALTDGALSHCHVSSGGAHHSNYLIQQTTFLPTFRNCTICFTSGDAATSFCCFRSRRDTLRSISMTHWL
jgi:hypothetical protein